MADNCWTINNFYDSRSHCEKTSSSSSSASSSLSSSSSFSSSSPSTPSYSSSTSPNQNLNQIPNQSNVIVSVAEPQNCFNNKKNNHKTCKALNHVMVTSQQNNGIGIPQNNCNHDESNPMTTSVGKQSIDLSERNKAEANHSASQSSIFTGSVSSLSSVATEKFINNQQNNALSGSAKASLQFNTSLSNSHSMQLNGIEYFSSHPTMQPNVRHVPQQCGSGWNVSSSQPGNGSLINKLLLSSSPSSAPSQQSATLTSLRGGTACSTQSLPLLVNYLSRDSSNMFSNNQTQTQQQANGGSNIILLNGTNLNVNNLNHVTNLGLKLDGSLTAPPTHSGLPATSLSANHHSTQTLSNQLANITKAILLSSSTSTSSSTGNQASLISGINPKKQEAQHLSQDNVVKQELILQPTAQTTNGLDSKADQAQYQLVPEVNFKNQNNTFNQKSILSSHPAISPMILLYNNKQNGCLPTHMSNSSVVDGLTQSFQTKPMNAQNHTNFSAKLLPFQFPLNSTNFNTIPQSAINSIHQDSTAGMNNEQQAQPLMAASSKKRKLHNGTTLDDQDQLNNNVLNQKAKKRKRSRKSASQLNTTSQSTQQDAEPSVLVVVDSSDSNQSQYKSYSSVNNNNTEAGLKSIEYDPHSAVECQQQTSPVGILRQSPTVVVAGQEVLLQEADRKLDEDEDEEVANERDENETNNIPLNALTFQLNHYSIKDSVLQDGSQTDRNKDGGLTIELEVDDEGGGGAKQLIHLPEITLEDSDLIATSHVTSEGGVQSDHNQLDSYLNQSASQNTKAELGTHQIGGEAPQPETASSTASHFTFMDIEPFGAENVVLETGEECTKADKPLNAEASGRTRDGQNGSESDDDDDDLLQHFSLDGLDLSLINTLDLSSSFVGELVNVSNPSLNNSSAASHVTSDLVTSQHPLPTILDYSPDWSPLEGGAKVLMVLQNCDLQTVQVVSVHFESRDSPSSSWTTEADISQIQSGLIRFVTPPRAGPPCVVQLSVKCHVTSPQRGTAQEEGYPRLLQSNAVPFTYRSICSTISHVTT